MTFGQKLSKLRKENNYTQEQLADILGVSRQSVSKWESDSAYPETDKLISLSRLFDCSVDYLLKDECNDKNSQENEAKSISNHQKIIGYILLTVSLLAGVLIVLLAQTEEQIFILLPFIFSVLTCSMICLFVNHRAGYWCVWAALSPITIFLPFIIWLSVLNKINLIAICFYIIMFFVAKRVFTGILPTAKSKRFVIIGWIALVIFRVFSYVLFTNRIIDSLFDILPYILMNLIMYIGVAVLVTFTARIIRNKNRVG